MNAKDRRIDEYIVQFPEEQQIRLKALRALIHETVPLVRETMKYAVPACMFEGDLVYIAAFTAHIGVYPLPSGITHFSRELLAYHTTKGAIQFPLEKPLPLDLIRRIILFRVEENMQMQEEKRTR